eukprot:GEMP01008653.1.p1 GENE.GEMP01008653.1~~GEMP01008653.1.p1  ORF type:complete len:686 (+),score=105.32 GEMP01008653.1:83-2140(+)
MAPHSRVVERFVATRGQIAEWLKDPECLNKARQHFPFNRMTAPRQEALLEKSRLKYIELAQRCKPDREIIIERHEVKDFDLLNVPHDQIELPKFSHGLYNGHSGAVVDFANEHLGGGFLTYGCAQEEVMWLERLDVGFFTAMKYAEDHSFTMTNDQALVIFQCCQWSHLEYYGRVPEDWEKRTEFFDEPQERGPIIAIDCLVADFERYDEAQLVWMLEKAYVGFHSVKEMEISTGCWGCGVFLNNQQVVMCIQVLAAVLADKKLNYYGRADEHQFALLLIKKWNAEHTPVRECFYELLHYCQTDDEFMTHYEPGHRRHSHHGEFPEINLHSPMHHPPPHVPNPHNYIDHFKFKPGSLPTTLASPAAHKTSATQKEVRGEKAAPARAPRLPGQPILKTTPTLPFRRPESNAQRTPNLTPPSTLTVRRSTSLPSFRPTPERTAPAPTRAPQKRAVPARQPGSPSNIRPPEYPLITGPRYVNGRLVDENWKPKQDPASPSNRALASPSNRAPVSPTRKLPPAPQRQKGEISGKEQGEYRFRIQGLSDALRGKDISDDMAVNDNKYALSVPDARSPRSFANSPESATTRDEGNGAGPANIRGTSTLILPGTSSARNTAGTRNTAGKRNTAGTRNNATPIERKHNSNSSYPKPIAARGANDASQVPVLEMSTHASMPSLVAVTDRSRRNG